MTVGWTGEADLGSVLADRYELLRLIARGGMSDVLEARDRLLDRRVAVKLYRAAAPTDRQRFDAEVRSLASVDHPNLVRLLDAGEHAGAGFVVLELIDGPTLGAVLDRRGSLPPEEASALGAALAGALAVVHAHGIVHRDVSPANVLCDADGQPRLTDFGIARLLDTTRVTAVASTIGTAAYMAPEQVEGREVTPAADVYSLGLLLLEAITGRREYPGAVHEAAMARLMRSPDVVTGVPPGWQPLLADMTALDPEERPRAAVVAERLASGARAASVTVDDGVRLVGAPGGDVVGDAEATTTMAAVDGATAVMPAVMRPVAAPPSDGPGDPPARAAVPVALWLVLAAVLIGAVLGIAARGDGLAVSPATTVAPVVATTSPPTTAAPVQPAPEDEGEGEDEDDDRGGNGKGKGRGGGDD